MVTRNEHKIQNAQGKIGTHHSAGDFTMVKHGKHEVLSLQKEYAGLKKKASLDTLTPSSIQIWFLNLKGVLPLLALEGPNWEENAAESVTSLNSLLKSHLFMYFSLFFILLLELKVAGLVHVLLLKALF